MELTKQELIILANNVYSLQAIRDAIAFKNGSQAYSVVFKFYGVHLSSNRVELTFHYANEFIKNSEYPYLIDRARSKANKAYRNNIANSNGNFHIDNYFSNSYGIFKGCKAPNRNPDFVSPSGSKYWYGSDKNGDFVIRKSNHWSKLGNKKYKHVQIKSNISSCYWVLNLSDNTPIKSEYTGKCYFADFKRNINTPS